MGTSRGRKLAAWTAIALVWTLGSAGCTEPLQAGSSGAGGAGSTGSVGVTSGAGGTGSGGSSACGAAAPIAIDSDATFAPTSGPDRAHFKAVAATPKAVLATTGVGLHRSKDGGDTWSLLDAKAIKGKSISAIAALGADIFASVNDTAIYRSKDAGDTWEDVSSAGCAAPSYLSVRGAELYALAGGQPFRWSSAAETWEALPMQDQSFDVIESDGAALYANSLYSPGVYRLALGAPGAEWTMVDTLPAWGYSAFAFFDDGYGFAANTMHISRTKDGGATFAPLDLGTNVNVVDLFVWNDALFAATSSAIWVSTDRGDHFTKTPISAMPSGFALASDGAHVFVASDGVSRAAGAEGPWERLHILGDSISSLTATAGSVLSVSESGFLRTTDGGASWSPVALEGGNGYPALPWSFVARDGSLFALSGKGSILASKNDGESFRDVSVEPAKSKYLNFLSSIDEGLVIGVSTGAGMGCSDAQDITTTLYLSTNGGETWAEAMNGFPATFTDCYKKNFTPMIVEVAQAGSALLAATHHNGLYRSVDKGKTWQPVPVGDAVGGLFHIVKAGEVVLATAEHGGVMRSLDDGASFELSGFEGLPVTSLVSVGGAVFAGVEEVEGAEGAVYVSSDAGGSWARVDAAFKARVQALAVQGDRLFAGTNGQSTWAAPVRCAAAP